MTQLARKMPKAVSQRMGPRPLGLHLTMGLCASLSLPSMLPSLRSASPNSNPASPALPEKLQALLNTSDPAFDAALGTLSLTRARDFIAGVKAYRAHPAKRDVPEAPVVWQEGTTQLRDYNPISPHAPVFLVVPSLINRFDILDLDYAPSFLRSLAAAGWRPLVVDWDEPGEGERRFAFDDYAERLAVITDWLITGKKKSPDLHLLGYCMGGLLALALATAKPDRFKSLTLLATPWDFHKPDPATGILLSGLADAWWDEPANESASMPVDVIQYLFALQQPLLPIGKFVDFATMDQGSMEARQFVLVEDWLNDGVPLPLNVARTCLKEWYGENATAAFQWRVLDRIVDPRKLAMPSYVVVPGHDRIVHPEAARPLAKLLPHATLHEPMTGHIGMMASRNASQHVWKPMLHWLDQHR